MRHAYKGRHPFKEVPFYSSIQAFVVNPSLSGVSVQEVATTAQLLFASRADHSSLKPDLDFKSLVHFSNSALKFAMRGSACVLRGAVLITL